MVRLGKLTDYGLLLMCQMARKPLPGWHAARDLAVECRLPLPTVSKLLKTLLQGGLVVSQRGIKGGYTLARDPHEISLAEIISAVEGPFGLTECSTDVGGLCDLEASCPIKDNQRIISSVVRGALERVMLSDLTRPMRLTAIRDNKGNLVPMISGGSGRVQ
ncbi:MAG TPA: SUF system Fe-S cluster assembly regulator [Verrucomicrobiae bacterium]|nr:SUF system Fe-S cluster assembly regulator [Verrucomicrobiae bacterium]